MFRRCIVTIVIDNTHELRVIKSYLNSPKGCTGKVTFYQYKSRIYSMPNQVSNHALRTMLCIDIEIDPGQLSVTVKRYIM